MDKLKERILVIPTECLFDYGRLYFQGFLLQGSLSREIQKRILQFTQEMDRGDAEENPEFKQLIPYCIVTAREEALLIERLPTQGEARLHGKLSIGIGGHAQPNGPRFSWEVLQQNLKRELTEELVFTDGAYPLPILIGMLNWDADQVGKVHFGLVYHVAVLHPDAVQINEKDQMIGGFAPLDHLVSYNTAGRYEPWSDLILKHYLYAHLNTVELINRR